MYEVYMQIIKYVICIDELAENLILYKAMSWKV